MGFGRLGLAFLREVPHIGISDLSNVQHTKNYSARYGPSAGTLHFWKAPELRSRVQGLGRKCLAF